MQRESGAGVREGRRSRRRAHAAMHGRCALERGRVGRELVRRLVGLRGRPVARCSSRFNASASAAAAEWECEVGRVGLAGPWKFLSLKSTTVLGLDLEIFTYRGLWPILVGPST